MILASHFALRAALLCGFAALAAPSLAQETPATGGDRIPVLSYVIVDGVSAPEPLTTKPADAERGKATFFNPEVGGCARCHWVPGVKAERESLAGPALHDVGARLASGAIRLWIINPRALKEGAKMPAYYSLSPQSARRPGDTPKRVDPLLTPQEVEDLVAYLESMSAAPVPTPTKAPK
ncbi:MAG: cytochrome c [Neomegalonema sp.]|nr:cytochrome c [Neomegalonema sp.]